MEAYQKNLQAIRQRVDNAARKSGRRGEDVKIIGVTKYVGVDETAALVNAGCRVLGESRPQLLWEKAEALSKLDIEWHLIGHLQRNKAKRTLELVTLIHSVDSYRLAVELNRLAQINGTPVNVLLEVNVSGESAKYGFQASEMTGIIDQIAELEHVNVQGLMCMAGLSSDADSTRREFASLRELSHQQFDLPDNIRFDQLSMGMSGDFEVAIEEGATMVRIGSLLFEGITKR